MATGNYVGYLRVSTDRQGKSGLGLEAQERAVQTYLNGGDWKLIETFVEVESGKKDDRPELLKALEACKLFNATLVIARLDRLSRDAAFLLNLQKAGVRFVAVDLPHADNFTVGILAMVAQRERELISERTKAALQSAKARGVKLGGNPANLEPHADAGRTKGRQAQANAADERAQRLSKLVLGMRDRGLSLRAMAAELNDKGVATPRGGKWSADTVRAVLLRL